MARQCSDGGVYQYTVSFFNFIIKVIFFFLFFSLYKYIFHLQRVLTKTPSALPFAKGPLIAKKWASTSLPLSLRSEKKIFKKRKNDFRKKKSVAFALLQMKKIFKKNEYEQTKIKNDF
jgi:hypothetical protein